jgi:DNA-binding PadR family transcriptional regulator
MSLRYAILGFLSVQPMSGYDLKKAFDGSVGHFWTADQAQIYRTLIQLIEGGLVEASHIAQQGKPDRKEHRLTDDGRAELDAWLASPEQPLPTREPFLLRVFFAGRLGRESVRQMLAHRLEAGERQLAVLQEISATVDRAFAGKAIDLDQRLRYGTLDNGIKHTQAEIDWARALLDQIEQEIPQ